MDYPFTRCLHPRVVVNPYTREAITAPCGCCQACLLAKSDAYKLKCTLESLFYPDTFFITLTYASEWIPKAIPYIDNEFGCQLIDSETGEVLCDVSPDDLSVELFRKLGSRYIPYLSKYDLQLFLKRLRKHYEKKYKCKLRYYAVGEYGPKHFRPHYHLLLWFETPADVSDLEEVVREKWPFGRIDVQKAKGDCSRYVAGYANSFSFVPPVLRARSFRPFCLHSQKLGEKIMPNEYAQIYETPYDNLVSRSFFNDGNFTEFRLWRSALTRFFPRCYSYDSKDSFRRYDSYTIYRYAKVIPHDNMFHLAKRVMHYVDDANYHNSERNRLPVVYDYFKNLFPNEWYLHYTRADLAERILQRIYRELLISKRFCDLADSLPLDGYVGLYFGQYSSRDQAFFYIIERFYSQRDLSNLKGFYEKQVNYFAENPADDTSIMQFYSPYVEVEEVLSSIDYRRFREHIEERFANAIKHKKQNDANKILFND